jgi:hypothetical protein
MRSQSSQRGSQERGLPSARGDFFTPKIDRYPPGVYNPKDVKIAPVRAIVWKDPIKAYLERAAE